jgi:3-Ketosteroid 9alpha-hydroxylase C-terminal domain
MKPVTGPDESGAALTFGQRGFPYSTFPSSWFQIARITSKFSSCTLGAFTPIDQRSSMGFASVWVPKKDPGEERPSGFAAAMIRANHDQLFGDRHDRPIFEHLHYLTKPLHLPEEASLHREFRAWATQFYPAE